MQYRAGAARCSAEQVQRSAVQCGPLQPLGAGQCGGGVAVEQQCSSTVRPLGALLHMQCSRADMHVADAAQILQCSTVQGNAAGADSATRHPAGYGLWCYDGGATGGGAAVLRPGVWGLAASPVSRAGWTVQCSVVRCSAAASGQVCSCGSLQHRSAEQCGLLQPMGAVRCGAGGAGGHR